MATTPIKDVGSVMNLQAAMGNMAAGAAKNAGGDFQSVLNNQTHAGKKDVFRNHPVKDAGNKAKPGEELRAKKYTRKDVRSDDVKDDVTDADLEKAAEVVGTAANELMTQIADAFEIPVEELQGLMTQMGLEPADLFDPENLSALLLQVSGAEDSMAFLTNEKLYGDYQMLMAQGEELAESVAGELAVLSENADAVMAELVADGKAENEAEGQFALTEENDGAKPGGQSLQTQTTRAEENKTEDHSSQNRSEKSEAKHSAANGEGNLVLQTIRDQQFAPEMEVAQAGAGREVDTQDIMRQIMDYMRVQIRPDQTSMEMQLHPASLGTLQIQVEARGGVLTANFITQNEAVKAALEGQMVQLQENLEQQGLKVEAIEVTVATHQFEQNLDQQGRDGERSGEAQEARRPRVRRLNLGGPDEPGMAEDLTEEDWLAAEMLAANGGTVDYMA